MKKRKSPKFVRPVQTKCTFCESDTSPDYKNHEVLKSSMTSRGKILGRTRTGVCQKHQRRLGLAVKRARHLARLPYVSQLG